MFGSANHITTQPSPSTTFDVYDNDKRNKILHTYVCLLAQLNCVNFSLCLCACAYALVWVTDGLHVYTAVRSVCVPFSHVCVRSEFNMAAHQFETPTSTIVKSASTNDRQRKNENIGVLLSAALSQPVFAPCCLCCMWGEATSHS